MRAVLHFLHKRSEDVMVGLMVIMFASFIIQIATRYVFNAPTEWTYEVILITWLWAVFWGAAFLLEDKDHVKFDILYNVGRREDAAEAGAVQRHFPRGRLPRFASGDL